MSDATIEDIYRCTPRQARRHIVRCIRKGRVPFLQSSPGIGKSAITRDIAKEFGLKLIDHRLSTSPPEDLTGLPFFKDGLATFAPFMDLFPLAGISIIPDGFGGWLLFLDEFNSAERPTQAAAYKLILDKMIGQFPLHPNVAVVCAGNLNTDKAIVNDLSTAMQSRLIHIFMEVSHPEWMEDVAIAQNYDERIIAYHNFKKTALMDFDPDHNNSTFCCPRTWEFMNDLVKGEEIEDADTPLFAGTITPGEAVSFVQFTKVYETLATVKDIVRDPAGAEVPRDRATAFALVTHLADNINEKNFEDLCTFVNRMGMEMRIVFFRTAMVRHPELRHNPHYSKAMLELQKHLYTEENALAA